MLQPLPGGARGEQGLGDGDQIGLLLGVLFLDMVRDLPRLRWRALGRVGELNGVVDCWLCWRALGRLLIHASCCVRALPAAARPLADAHAVRFSRVFTPYFTRTGGQIRR